MGRRIVTVFEVLLIMTLFSMFAALVITTTDNDNIVENTESFVELVRYKGCITDEMYSDFIGGFRSPVDVSIVVTKKGQLNEGDTIQFTGDVVDALENERTNVAAGIIAGTYTMKVGDEIQVIVRKTTSTYFDNLMGFITGTGPASSSPAVAIKGGMILNTQYPTA